MKRLHRPDLYGWTVFDEVRDIDFHSVLWVRRDGNVVVDPLPLSAHDQEHLQQLGGAAFIVITNADHVREAEYVANLTGAQVLGPRRERDDIPLVCSRWLGEGDQVVPGLRVIELEGSKTAGELALVLDETTLICGDLIRAHEGGRLCLLPDSKLADKQQALASVRRLAALPSLQAVLPGDGWPVFRDAQVVLNELLASIERDQ